MMYPNYSNVYPNYYQPQIQQQSQNQQQIQNGGFLTVPNETYARNYPVAPGNSVTFKDESAPYVYTKTMGFSQLDIPVFEKYRLVKENVTQPIETKEIDYQKEIDDLRMEIEKIKRMISEEDKEDAEYVTNDKPIIK
jgi:hypothetical protein